MTISPIEEHQRSLQESVWWLEAFTEMEFDYETNRLSIRPHEDLPFWSEIRLECVDKEKVLYGFSLGVVPNFPSLTGGVEEGWFPLMRANELREHLSTTVATIFFLEEHLTEIYPKDEYEKFLAIKEEDRTKGYLEYIGCDDSILEDDDDEDDDDEDWDDLEDEECFEDDPYYKNQC